MVAFGTFTARSRARAVPGAAVPIALALSTAALVTLGLILVLGVFEATPPPPRSKSSGASEFEIATGDMPGRRAELASGVPAVQEAPKSSDESGELPADLFEPDTARINAPTSPFPDPMPDQDFVTPGPITAFPISDFIPNHSQKPSAVRRHYAPIAVAAAVLLGLSFLIWQETIGRPRPGSPLQAAAAHAPAAVGNKPAQPSTPTVTTESTSAPIAVPVVPAPTPEPTVEVEAPAPPVLPAPPRPTRRRASRAEPATQPAASPVSTGNGAPFIPDDI